MLHIAYKLYYPTGSILTGEVEKDEIKGGRSWIEIFCYWDRPSDWVRLLEAYVNCGRVYRPLPSRKGNN